MIDTHIKLRSGNEINFEIDNINILETSNEVSNIISRKLLLSIMDNKNAISIRTSEIVYVRLTNSKDNDFELEINNDTRFIKIYLNNGNIIKYEIPIYLINDKYISDIMKSIGNETIILKYKDCDTIYVINSCNIEAIEI